MSTTSSRPSTNKVLFILSSFDHFVESGKPTGWYLSEAAHPYHVLTAAGKEIVFASPSGGAAPLDPSSIEAAKDDKISLDFLHGETTKAAVANTLPLSSIKYDDFDAVFAVGGHGPLFVRHFLSPFAVVYRSVILMSSFPLASVGPRYGQGVDQIN